ncbi:MAG: hypothetical protein ACLP01_11440 [Solirubrobacteraceae bacterium]
MASSGTVSGEFKRAVAAILKDPSHNYGHNTRRVDLDAKECADQAEEDTHRSPAGEPELVDETH